MGHGILSAIVFGVIVGAGLILLRNSRSRAQRQKEEANLARRLFGRGV